MRLRYLEPMGVFKSIADKAKEQRDELAKKAAKKAARTALEQGAKAAMGAIDAAGNAIEKVIFGDSEREAPSKKGRDEPEGRKEPVPDPFAKLKAAAEAMKQEEREEEDAARRARAAKVAEDEKAIDAELEALKKRLGS
jgi:hypothetical protein